MIYKNVKRLLDVIFSIILFVLFIPLWIVIPILIKADSAGRVVFTQKRVGSGSNYFKIYKFRTMKEGTPDIPTDKVKNQKDLNTKLGTTLRRLSIDEIPQLYNILKGEMSFVGPRPALYNQARLISLRKERSVDRIRPGVTGLAQVSGRDSLTIPEKVRYDSRYVDEMSLWLDAKIVFVTVRAVLNGKGGN
ncbi:MAG: sugar transferase [Actinobacteria bacterium]|nr:sugar transferase [Actinomycetota bacterium]